METRESARWHCARCKGALSAIPVHASLCTHLECGKCGSIYVDEGDRLVPCMAPLQHVGKGEMKWPGE